MELRGSNFSDNDLGRCGVFRTEFAVFLVEGKSGLMELVNVDDGGGGVEEELDEEGTTRRHCGPSASERNASSH
jgi:hypothetical protein